MYVYIFITGTGKSHVVQLIERDMTYFQKNVLNADPDQPIVLIAPTGSATYQIGGSTIESALLIYDNFNNKPSWLKHNTMQLKLQHMILSLTDEISMVGYQKFQQMNQTICTIKVTHDGNWGNICVLVVGDLYQLSPVAQSPIYMPPQTVRTLDDTAPNGWEEMKLHELTEIMQQKDITFAECLNNISVAKQISKCISVPEPGSKEDIMLQSCELQITRDDPNYPTNAMHIFAQNEHCDEWNARRLALLYGTVSTSVASDEKKDDCAQLATLNMPE